MLKGYATVMAEPRIALSVIVAQHMVQAPDAIEEQGQTIRVSLTSRHHCILTGLAIALARATRGT